MSAGGLRWAAAIALAAYAAQALGLIVWLAIRTPGDGARETAELLIAARWIPFTIGAAIIFLGGLVLGRLRALDEAMNLALLAAGLFLALDVSLSIILVPQTHSWDWAAYSFVTKAVAGTVGVLIAGGGGQRR